MNPTSNFSQNISNFRAAIAGNIQLIHDFQKAPAETVKNRSLDFLITKGSQQILFSEYLCGISDEAQQVVVASVLGSVRTGAEPTIEDELDDDSDDDEWIDDVGGGVTAAVAVVGVAVFAATVANLAVTANVLTAANAIYNVNAVASGYGGSCGSCLGRGASSLNQQENASVKHHGSLGDTGGNALTSELSALLKERGLNGYRQATLIKRLAWKTLPKKVHKSDDEITVQTIYKDIRIEMAYYYVDGGYQLVRAGII